MTGDDRKRLRIYSTDDPFWRRPSGRRRAVRIAIPLIVVAGVLSVFLMRATPQERAAQLRAVAQTRMRELRFADAEPLLRQAILEVPDDAESLGLLGETLLRSGREEEAVLVLRRVLARDPSEPRASVLLAAHYLRRGEVDEAAALAGKAGTESAHGAELALVRADVALARGNLGAALAELANAVERRPGDAELRLRTAYVAEYAARAAWSSAAAGQSIRSFEAAARSDAPRERAAALLGLDRPGEAADAIAKVAASPGNAALRAAILDARGASGEAARLYLDEVTSRRSADTCAAYATWLTARGRREEAASLLEAAAQEFPRAAAPAFAGRALAAAEAAARSPDDLLVASLRLRPSVFNPAEATLSDRVVRGASDPVARRARLAETGPVLLAEIRRGRRPPELARSFGEDVAALLAADAADPAGLVWKAALLLRDGKPTEAAQTLEPALGLDPPPPQAFVVLAEVHAGAGDWPLVIEDIGRVEANGLRTAAVVAARVRALTRSGRPRDAVAAGRAAMSRWPDDLSLAASQVEALDADAAAAASRGEPRDMPSAEERALLEARLGLARGDVGAVWRAADGLAGTMPRRDAGGVGTEWVGAAARAGSLRRERPGDPALVATHAALLVRTGRVDEAADVLRASSASTGDPLVGLLLQRLLAFRGDFAGAEAVLRKMLKEHPGLYEADLALAGVLASAGRAQEAVLGLRRLVDSDAPSRIRVAAAGPLLALSASAEDIERVERFVASGPAPAGDARRAALAGYCRLARGDVEGALAVAAAAKSANPGRAEPSLLAAFAHAQARRFDDAERAIADALAVSPGAVEATQLLARVRFDRGVAALRAGDLSAASAALEGAVSGAETDFAPLMLLAVARARGTDEIGDRAMAARLAARLPRRPAASLLLGYVARIRGRPEQALQKFTDACGDSPDHPAALAALVATALALDDVAAAETACRTFLDRGDPTGVGAGLLGRCLMTKRDAKGAEKAWRDSLEKHPGNVASLTGLVPVLVAARRVPDAKVQIERCRKSEITFDERGVQALRVLAAQGSAAGEGDRVVERVAAVCAARPSSGWIQFEIGRAYAVAGDLEQAHTVLDAAVAALPGETPPHLELLRVFGLRGKVAEAVPRFEAAAREHGDEPAPWFTLGMIAEFDGDLDTAERHYKRALAARPDFVLASNNLAWMLGETRSRVDDGLAVARAAKRYAPADADLADTYGWLLYRAGEDLAALAEFEIAVKARPRNSHFLYHRAETLLRLGRREEARTAFERVMQIDAAYGKQMRVPETLAQFPAR